MSSNYKLVFGVVLGAALGAAAVQGLHAQAKPKAYSVTETEVLDATAQAAYSPQVQAAQKAASGRSIPHCWWKDCCTRRGGGSQARCHHRVG